MPTPRQRDGGVLGPAAGDASGIALLRQVAEAAEAAEVWRVIRCGLVVLGLALAAHAEIIDRIAVSVANRVITTSDLDRQIRVAAFQSGTKPDFSPAAKKAMADRMVEYTLVRREIETSHYPVHAAAEIEPALAEFKKQYYKSDEDYRAALAHYGITEQDVREELLRERTLNAFLEVRFRPAVQVTEQEIQAYFEKNFPAGSRLEELHDRIEQTLTAQRVDQEVNAWLERARARTEVVYHPEALQ
jgi:peptidyl-prolyl cis-trans isomerase SurA